MVSTSEIKPYALFDSVYNLQYVELYGGGENDPIIDASLYAQEHLAFDSAGNRLPFSIQVSLNAQYLDRDKMLLEDKGRKTMRFEQLVILTVIVFSCVEDYMWFESGNRPWMEN